MDASDAQLVARCRQDREALHASFRDLYRRHAGPTYRFLCGLVGEVRARDCLQETFLRVYRSLDRYDPGRPFGAWLMGVARNVALDTLRREGRRPAEPLADRDPPQPEAEPVPVEASRRELTDLVRAAVGALPWREREVFLLKHVEGLTFEQVAGAVGCSVRTAKYRMRAAVDALGRDLRQRGVAGGA